MAYADDLVRELLVFRGFAHTLAAFEAELAADKLHPPQAQRVAQHIMRELIPALDWRALARLFLVLRERFVARADGASCAALEELEVGVQRLFMVTALRAGRRAEVVRVLEEMGESVQALLLAAPDDWTLWFDVNAASQIACWPVTLPGVSPSSSASSSASASPLSPAVCVRFLWDHSSLFSLSASGQITEWSLHKQGQLLRHFDAASFCTHPPGNTAPVPSTQGTGAAQSHSHSQSQPPPVPLLSARSLLLPHELTIDSQGSHLLTTSSSHSPQLLNLHLPHPAWHGAAAHAAPVTTVDWHPTALAFASGSADHTVRIVSLK
ncbi:hypothetical protein CLOM_g21880 [Closterium sp. NIES-68]|nr:hypothetical protein CLOM_g21880 [Closterium sp. NIES-68]GJP69689.1 hypothetical protein CLOP_g676 [Closterium sp. NIES-67]